MKKISENSIAKDKKFKIIWENYNKTFFDFNGEQKTDCYSYDFFNEKSLLASKINLKLLSAIPSLLVGIGILGTFCGLTFGITDFNTTTTEDIKNSIETLFSGMGTAFVSSIYGMAASLLFTLIEKTKINSLRKSIYEFYEGLDEKYKISSEDKLNIELEKQKKIISDYFIFTDENNNRVNPANIFRDIYNESVKQSKAMQAFSSDLAEKIEAGFNAILSDQIQKGVIPELQSLKSEIKNLGKKLKDPATEMTQNIVKDLELALDKMINEFKTSLSGSTQSELEKLAVILGEAGGALTSFPDNLFKMTENLNENFKNLQGTVQDIAKQTLAQSNESTEQMKDQVERMTETFKNRVGELQIGQEVLITKQSENMQVSDKLLSAFNISIEKMNGLSTNVTETISKFGKVQDGFNSTAEQLKLISDNINNSSETFKNSFDDFKTAQMQFFDNNSKTIKEIQESLLSSKEVSADYVEKFGIIEKGLESIFNQIKTGLSDYTNTIDESVKKFLDNYTDELKKSADALAGAIDKQEDILEGLTEQLDKFNERKIKS
ncbi:MAG: MotA/TolQ/ExbB proton channel family protein [Deltaproteobacteria bacterium]|nr:MotA/TolQ/ExbB proton channel family protein [Deltaproteobacteria bacterium]